MHCFFLFVGIVVTDLSHLPTENLVPRCPAESSEDSESSSSSSSSSSEDDCSDVESVVR